jgi:hypothetical protein
MYTFHVGYSGPFSALGGATTSVDINSNAFRIVQAASSERPASKSVEAKRLAGSIGGTVRAERMDPAKRREIAVAASTARWSGKTDALASV